MSKLLSIGREENSENYFRLNILNVQREQKKYLIKINYKLSAYISYWSSGYSKQALDKVEIILYDSKIYVPQTLRRRVLDWYHFYLNHPGGSRLAKTIIELCCLKSISTQT